MDGNGLKMLANDGTFKEVSASGMVYPNEDTLLNGFGNFDKLKNKYIDDNSIDPLKLLGSNGDGLKVLLNNGLFGDLFTFE